MPLRTKGKRAFVSVSAVVVFGKKFALPECVLHEHGCGRRARSSSWPSEHPVDAKIDSREPHIPEGRNSRHLLSLTGCGVGPRLPGLPRVSSY